MPEDRFAPLHMHEQTDVGPVIAVCEAFWVQELLFEVLDTLLCAVLVVYTVYIVYTVYTQKFRSGCAQNAKLEKTHPKQLDGQGCDEVLCRVLLLPCRMLRLPCRLVR